MSDHEQTLLKRAHFFEMDALAEIYDSYSPEVFRYAMRLLGDRDIAEDCVADTFSRFLKALHDGGGPQSHLRAYLYRIAHNWIVDYYRHRPLPPLSLSEDLHDDDPNPLQLAVENIQAEQVRLALLRLTAEQRQVIVLKFLEGWENEAIARLLDKPVGAVKALQHRALGALRRVLLLQEENSHDSH